ncbi:DUF6382 domain-containing protein [Lachnospiraceae bacterium 62-35]
MEVRYQREMKHNYLIVRPDNQNTDSYQIHMMTENKIEGLLKMHIRNREEETFYYYEITSKQPLSRILENRGMKSGEIRKLISDIGSILDRMEVYLLGEEGICLEEDYIYIEPATYQTALCLVPGRQGNFTEDMRKLLQYLLGKIDHRDKEGVVLAYGLFQESQKENYGICDLLKIIYGEEKKADRGDITRQNQDMDEKWAEEGFSTEEDWSHELYQRDRRTWEERHIQEKGTKKKRMEKEKCCTEKEKTEEKVYKGKRFTGLKQRLGWGLMFLGIGVCVIGWFIIGRDWMGSYGIKIGAGITVAAVIIQMILTAGEKESSLEIQKGNAKEKRIEQAEKEEEKEQRGRKKPDNRLKNLEKKKADKKDADFWMMELEEIADNPEEHEEKRRKREAEGEIGEKGEVRDTVLLTDLGEKQEERKLISLENEREEIKIAYYPFLIGKQEELVDYIMNYETVSRLHVRIDKTEEGYRITDLNSTNGTTVGSHMLEANESVELEPGEKVYIADKGFLFI